MLRAMVLGCRALRLPRFRVLRRATPRFRVLRRATPGLLACFYGDCAPLRAFGAQENPVIAEGSLWSFLPKL